MLFLDADTLSSFFLFIFPHHFLCVLQCELYKHVRPLRPRRQNTQEVRCCCFVNTLKIYLNEQLEKLGWFSPKRLLSKLMAHKSCCALSICFGIITFNIIINELTDFLFLLFFISSVFSYFSSNSLLFSVLNGLKING